MCRKYGHHIQIAQGSGTHSHPGAHTTLFSFVHQEKLHTNTSSLLIHIIHIIQLPQWQRAVWHRNPLHILRYYKTNKRHFNFCVFLPSFFSTTSQAPQRKQSVPRHAMPCHTMPPAAGCATTSRLSCLHISMSTWQLPQDGLGEVSYPPSISQQWKQ